MDVEIRAGQRKDVKSIAAMLKCLAEDQGREGQQPSEADLIRDGFDEHFPWFHSLVAENFSNGSHQLIGLICYSNMYSATNGRILFMSGFFVKPEFRKLGVGTKLYNHLKEIAFKNKCKALRYFVNVNNKNALGFYHNQGATNLCEQRQLTILSDISNNC